MKQIWLIGSGKIPKEVLGQVTEVIYDSPLTIETITQIIICNLLKYKTYLSYASCFLGSRGLI